MHGFDDTDVIYYFGGVGENGGNPRSAFSILIEVIVGAN